MTDVKAMARSGVAVQRGARALRKHGKPPADLGLASEALEEDVAPYEPGRGAGRLGIFGMALALGLLGVAMRAGVGRGSLPADSSSLTLAAAGASVALAALPFSYPIRAGAATVLGVALIALGTRGLGPLILARSAADTARLVALVALPGALLFRARYRAYRGARSVLAAALAISLPFAVDRTRAVFDPSL